MVLHAYAQAGEVIFLIIPLKIYVMQMNLNIVCCSLERLPSLRPKRDLTLGGVPKVSEISSLCD